ncbi:MAG: hypothetical protein H7240_02210 [Glaciimonas sp.]|nr:hypothetical protein [Glaciimonas sp.]
MAEAAGEIEDNGLDIPEAEREQVFDLFYRILIGNDEEVQGWGFRAKNRWSCICTIHSNYAMPASSRRSD